MAVFARICRGLAVGTAGQRRERVVGRLQATKGLVSAAKIAKRKTPELNGGRCRNYIVLRKGELDDGTRKRT